MNSPLRYLPGIVAGLAGIYLLAYVIPPHDPADQMQVHEFGKLPVLDHGRVKPIDTLARNSLMVISSRQTYRDADGKEQPAIKWLLDVMTSSRGWEERQVFTIEDADLRSHLGLMDRPGYRYSYADLGEAADVLREIGEDPARAGKKFDTPSGRKVLDLAVRIALYANVTRYDTPHQVFRIENEQVLTVLGLERREGFRYAFSEFAPKLPQLFREAGRAVKVEDKDRDAYDTKLVEMYEHVQLYIGLATLRAENLSVFPPRAEGQPWQTERDVMKEAHTGGEPNPAFTAFHHMLNAYAAGDAQKFNQEVTAYRQRVDGQMPAQMELTDFEAFFDNFAPFYHCTILYAIVFLLACLSWLNWTGPLNRAAFWLAVLVLVLHTLALTARIILSGRPPVTNLYSSAVFIGWGAGVLGLILEWIYRNGIGCVVTAVLGFTTTLIAHHLARGGDTLEMLQAVLDTNFWLATHVTCVTLGYAATFVAALLGIIFIVRGVLTTQLDRGLIKSLGQMIFAVVCFATLLSFTGTVLGGLWADYSWGRFWGWDPKENGALLIVLMNALILHARWGGMVKQRGMAVLAVVGGMVTGWSWFGTNQLGIGLHSYGFNKTLADVLSWFWVSQVCLIGMGLLPLRYWRSFAAQQTVPPPEKAPQPKRKPRADLEPELSKV
jgi:ABC-type transport system involved in cytochrome c biogenesis permease subunit